MMEPMSVSLPNGDRSDKPNSPPVTTKSESGLDEGMKRDRMDNLNSSPLEAPNHEATGSTLKHLHYPSLLKATSEQPCRKRGFLASELSNSDRGAFCATSPSRTSTAHSSSASSSSPASTGSSCNRDEVSHNSRCDESDVRDNPVVKRARPNALLQEDDRPGMGNSNAAIYTPDCATVSLNSKPKYRQRPTGKTGFVDLQESASTMRCSSIAAGDNEERCLSLAKGISREVGRASAPSSGRLRSPKTGLKGTMLQAQGHRLQKKEMLVANATGLDDDFEREIPGGSELTIAAYNNFVRRVVDDTLDRNITFCEQPRHAITALENICARAWPTLDMKRHRNRIRAYLKACRRNSKKNRGQINMKEPAMNGLSIEARQLVANALSLVSSEVEQLKMIIQDSSKSTFLPNSSSPGSSKDTIDSHYLVSTPTFGTRHKRADATVSLCSDQTPATPDLCAHSGGGLSRSHVFGNDFPDPPLAPPPHPPAFLQGSNNSQMPVSAYLPPGSPYFSPLPYSLDASYMAVMLRLLPTLMQYNRPGSSGLGQSACNNIISSPSNSQVPTKTHEGSARSECLKAGLPGSFDGHQFPYDSAFYGVSEVEKRNAPFPDEAVVRCHVGASEYNSFAGLAEADNSKPEMQVTTGMVEPPPAHMNSVQYSPSLQEAIGKLLGLEVCLAQDDTAYFRHNLVITQEAIKYAKAFSHMVLRKIELLEGQLQQPSQIRCLFSEHHPLNLS